jgi:hypothetical protein
LLVERPRGGRGGDAVDVEVLLALLGGGEGTLVDRSELDGDTNDLGGAVISPSGTWYIILGPSVRSSTAKNTELIGILRWRGQRRD